MNIFKNTIPESQNCGLCLTQTFFLYFDTGFMQIGSAVLEPLGYTHTDRQTNKFSNIYSIEIYVPKEERYKKKFLNVIKLSTFSFERLRVKITMFCYILPIWVRDLPRTQIYFLIVHFNSLFLSLNFTSWILKPDSSISASNSSL